MKEFESGSGRKAPHTGRTTRAGWLALFALTLTSAIGCGMPDGTNGKEVDMRAGRVPPASAHVAAYPASRNVPLDPSLRASAERELQGDLKSNDPEIRAHALEALWRGSAAQASEVLKAMDDPDAFVRYAGCLAAGQIRLKEAHDALLRLADDHDPAVRVVARYGLHRIGDYRYSHDLEQLSRDPQPQVRGTTAMVLGMLGEPSALKVLKPMRTDHHPAVRQQASAAMWQLGSQQGMDDLISWSLSKYPDDRMMAFIGLAEPRNRSVIQHVRNGLVSEYRQVALTAARAMGMLGSDEGYGLAEQGAASADPGERIEAALAFGAIGRSDAQDVLKKLLSDSDTNVRIAAAEAILELKPEFVPG